MPWQDVLLIDDNLDLVAAEVLDGVEHTIGCRLPADYRAVMTTFGVGTYCGLINFLHPDQIPVQTRRSREIWAEHSEFFGRNPIWCCPSIWHSNRSFWPRRSMAMRLFFALRRKSDYSFCLVTMRSFTRCLSVLVIRLFGRGPPEMHQKPCTFAISNRGGAVATSSYSQHGPT